MEGVELLILKMVQGLNLDGLNNLSPIVINTTIVDTPEKIISNTLSNTNDLTLQFYGLMVMLVLFIALTYILNREDEFFRFDLIRSILLSSGIVVMLGVIATIGGVFNDFRHVVWFLTIALIGLISVITLKQKGQ